MERVFLVLGALSAAFGVMAGAFGAHALEQRLTADMLDTYQTAVRYQLIHALGLLFVSWALTRWPGSVASVSGWLFVAGIALFSGSLYTLSITGIRVLGAIAPFGGLAFIIGWLVLAWVGWQGA